MKITHENHKICGGTFGGTPFGKIPPTQHQRKALLSPSVKRDLSSSTDLSHFYLFKLNANA